MIPGVTGSCRSLRKSHAPQQIGAPFGWKYQGSPGFTTGAVDGDTIVDGGRAPTGVGGSGTRGVPRAEGVRGIIAEEEEPVMHSQIMSFAAS